MSNIRHLGFGSTPNFSNLYHSIKSHATYDWLAKANYDAKQLMSDGIPSDLQTTIDKTLTLPTITFQGTEKVHGTNMAVCFTKDGLWVQGRKRIVEPGKDQNGMAMYVEANKEAWLDIFIKLADTYEIDVNLNTIVIDCEWAGSNIQGNNSCVSSLPNAAYVFSYFRIVSNIDDSTTYKPSTLIDDPDHNIFNLEFFSNFSLELNFNKPNECIKALEELALLYENNSPITDFYNKSDNVGEGVYLWCVEDGHPPYRLKAKGEKHGGAAKKHKQPKLSSEDKNKLAALAERITPVWRITQGISETNAKTMQDIGTLMKWVHQDILKEELPTLAADNVPYKKVQGFVSNIVKEYFIQYLNDNIKA